MTDPEQSSDHAEYLQHLELEKQRLDASFMHASRLLAEEIDKVRTGQGRHRMEIEVHKGKPVKMGVKVMVPVNDYPKFNFVGKLLGPKGNSLKRLQEETGTRMFIFGRGSMRNKEKEEQLRREGDRMYAHLNQELHVLVEAYATPADCYSRIGHAVQELQRFLVPINSDDISQMQMEELMYARQGENGSGAGSTAASPGPIRGRGAPPPPMPMPIWSRGRGGPMGRGAMGPRPPGPGRGMPMADPYYGTSTGYEEMDVMSYGYGDQGYNTQGYSSTQGGFRGRGRFR